MTANFTSINNLVKKHKDNQRVSKPKETEPVINKAEKIEIKETIEHQVAEEITPYVKQTHEAIKLPPDLKKFGLRAPSATNFPGYQNIKLPISDDKIISGLHAPITSSLRWLATLAIYILSRAHLVIKTIGGKTVRVVKK